MRPFNRVLMTLGTLCLLADSARAAVSGQIQVQLVINAGCEVSLGGQGGGGASELAQLDFGSRGPTWAVPLNTQLRSHTGDLAVTCASAAQHPTQFTVTLDGGAHGDGTTRYLSNGTRTLPYQLSVDEAGKDHYPVGQQRQFTADTGTQVAIPVYGAVVANTRALPAGTYSDTLTVRLDW